MPYKSKAQMRAFFAREAEGELPRGTARRWAHHTPNIAGLPKKLQKGRTKKATLADWLASHRPTSASVRP